MGNLAFLGSHKVNGVSALHTELMRQTVFPDLHELYPDRIINKTNGITFRRWLFEANPGLTELLVETIGADVPRRCGSAAEASSRLPTTRLSRRSYASVRRANKEALAKIITDQLLIKVDPDALFDVQIKRIHEYKRQLLNILETIALYNAIRAHPTRDWVPRVKIFAGKAAASYHQAKLIIKLIHDVARVVNNDPAVRGLLKVVFLPNYNVSLARGDHSRRRSVRADLDRRHGGFRHRQHEVRAERRADHRHAGRRQCRDQGARRRRQHLHLRPDRARRCRSAARKGIDARETIASLASADARCWTPSHRACFRTTSRTATGSLSISCTYHDHFMVTADFDAYCAAQRAAESVGATASRGGGRAS